MCKLLKPADWDLNYFIYIVIILNLVYSTQFLFGFIDIKIPILYGIIGFVIVSFIPGILILRILKIHYISSIENVLYIVGFSLVFAMLMGLLMNTFYPPIGIEKPFLPFSLYWTYFFCTFILIVLARIMDKEFDSSEHFLDLKLLFNPFTLFLLLIPFISIFGTYLMNFHANNILQLATLILIGIIILSCDRIPSKLYPFTIFIVSISLLFHKSLISNYVHGWDIQLAYRFSQITLQNNYWDYSFNNPYNSLLAFPVLSTIYANMCGINIHFVYKIIYSFLFSLAPLGLFHYYKVKFNFFDEKNVFIATLVFIFYYGFNADIVGKQKLAELFFVLLLMLMASTLISFSHKVSIIIFSFGVIQAHYGLSYIILVGFIFSYIALFLVNHENNQKYLLIRPQFIALFMVMTISWYLYASSSINFYNLLSTVEYSVNSLFNTLNNNVEPRTGIYILNEQITILHTINTILFLILSFFILLGILQNVHKLIIQKTTITNKYEEDSFLPLFFFLLLVSSFFISGNLGVDRIYQISLMILSPFSILGYQFAMQQLRKTLKCPATSKISFHFNFLNVFVLYLILFFAFNSGIAYYASNVHISANFAIDLDSEYNVYDNMEMNGALWLKEYDKHQNEYRQVYTDHFTMPILYEFYEVSHIHDIKNIYEIPDKLFYYCNTHYSNCELFGNNSKNKIYTNDKVEIYNI